MFSIEESLSRSTALFSYLSFSCLVYFPVLAAWITLGSLDFQFFEMVFKFEGPGLLHDRL